MICPIHDDNKPQAKTKTVKASDPMTNDEIRIKVAEAMGWACIRGETGFPTRHSRELGYYQTLPNYPEDLNACSTFEATLTDDEWDVYCENLDGSLRSCVSATARQRCLAYLKVKRILP